MAAETQIPHRAEDISAEWASAVLQRAGHMTPVNEVAVSPIGTGQMATSLRVDLDYVSDQAEAPDSVVVKIASLDPKSREAGARGAYLREVRYYQMVDDTVSVNAPEMMWADIDIDTNDFAIVLEDMRPAEQGDQITGCSEEQALAAAKNIAGLHAPRWGDESLFDHEWLTAPPAARAPGYEEAQMVVGMLTPGFIERYQGWLNDQQVNLLNWFAAHTARWLDTGMERFALTHADHRLDNLLFSADDADQAPSVVDWQTIGVRNPLADVAYLLGTGLEPSTRRSVEHDIVRDYHERLCQMGVADYSLGRCFDDYREQSLHTLLITVLGAMMTVQTDRGDEMFMAMLHRGSQQIFDLEAQSLP